MKFATIFVTLIFASGLTRADAHHHLSVQKCAVDLEFLFQEIQKHDDHRLLWELDLSDEESKIAFFKTNTKTSQNEYFKLDYSLWDTKKANDLIARGLITPKLETLDIRNYVETHLTQTNSSEFKVKVNMSAVKAIGQARADVPGIALSGPFGIFVVDGNHRMMKRYLGGKKTMQFYVVDFDTAEFFRLAN